MLYRICTENVNQNKIEKIVSKLFDGFTIVKGTGFWKRQKENSLIVEIVGDESDLNKVKSIASEIKVINDQDAVLVQRIENNNWLI